MVKMNLFRYTGRNDAINKDISNPTPLTGLLFDAFNILEPVLKIRFKGVFTFNYVYMPDFKRYYFIKNYRVQQNNVIELYLTVDVLKSYETELLTATGTIQQSTTANKHLSTRANVYDVKPKFEKVEFENTGFNEDGTLIMVTIKGE